MRRLALPALVAALLAGCSLDLDLPADRGTPTLTGFTPGAAYAGELITVQGSGFDPSPSSNRVQFASGATATALEVGAGTVVVRVPRGAGTGPLTASNGKGPGAPFGTFQYRGGGELAVRAARPPRVLTHTPIGIASTGADLFVESQLWGGLVSMLDKDFGGDGAAQAVSVAAGSALVWVDQTGHRLVRHDLGSDLRATTPYGGQRYARLARVAASGARPELVALVTWSFPGIVELTTFDAATLAEVDAPRQLPLDDFWAVADGGRGRIALLGVLYAVPPPAPPLNPTLDGLFLVTPGAADLWVEAPIGNTEFPALAETARQPLAVAPLPGGSFLAVFLDYLSNLRTVDLDPPVGAPTFDAGIIDTHALVEYASGLSSAGQWLAVSKRTENLILGIDLSTRSIAWSVSTPSPGPSTGAGALFEVASLTTNDALEIDRTTGVVLARRDLGLFPGRFAVLGGMGFCPAAACFGAELHILTGYPAGTLRTTPEGAPVFGPNAQNTGLGTADKSVLGVSVAAGVQWTWGQDASGAGWVSDWNFAGSMAVGGAIQGMVGDADSAWVVHASVSPTPPAATCDIGYGLSRVENGVVVGTSPFPTLTLPCDPLVLPAVRGPLDLPGGGAAVAYQAAGGWQVAILSVADTIAGAPPRPLALPRPATALFVSDGVPWVVYGGSNAGTWLAGADALAALPGGPTSRVDHVDLYDVVSDVVASSPNGQALVVVHPGTSDVLFLRADPHGQFALIADVPVEGTITGFTFDDTGEVAYLVTQVPERLVTLE